MKDSVRLLDRELMITALTALSIELSRREHPSIDLIVIGGSYLTLLDLRYGTNDIDTIRRIDNSVKESIIAVALKLAIQENWLNDNASLFMPANFDSSKCTTNLQLSKIRILIPHADVVFIMKLYASRREKDHDDMVKLWPMCSFKTAAAVIDYFWEAYPSAMDDEFLESLVQEIINEATI
jgi:hypothetical protein